MFEFITAACGGFLVGWISRGLMKSRIKTFRTSGHYGNCQDFSPAPPRPGYRRVYLYSPTQVAECGGPCKAGPEHCNCGALWRDEPIRLDPGSVQRGNGHGGPTTPKPDIIPKPQPSGRRFYRGAFYRMAGSNIWHPIDTEPDWGNLARERLSSPQPPCPWMAQVDGIMQGPAKPQDSAPDAIPEDMP